MARVWNRLMSIGICVENTFFDRCFKDICLDIQSIIYKYL